MMSVLGRNLVLALVLGKIEVLSARFFKVLDHRALSHNFSGIEVFIQECLYF